ncbi:TauD/TfdA family dioxygenase [Streptomyces bathyalis]|uniref:TauD/TfdA family dioxygenase n=1 Tax=Streptomyces bathyalis TaxID=2710756 RepID=A0A7T1T3T3_9ACTN|nr:TauD/TfdA family dioxygenase [Streptomyces bathyalis]QPP05835.1 TauD/TfdA family dioxygenase [Streptomyces bathyalis]
MSSPFSTAIVRPVLPFTAPLPGAAGRPGGPHAAPAQLHDAGTQRALAQELLRRADAVPFLDAVLEALHRDGYAVASVPGLAGMAVHARDALVVAASAAIGTPSPVGATDDIVVWDVRPRPELPEAQRRNNISVSDGEACLHTDSAFSSSPERWFGLWCVRPALSGGASVLVDAHRVWEVLGGSGTLRRARDTLLTTDVPMWNGQRLVPVRVFSKAGDGRPMVRYRADLLAQGVRLARLDPAGDIARSLTLLDEVLTEPSLREVVRLEEDQVVFVDNHRVMHAREHFTDPRRHLLRVRMCQGPMAHAEPM